MPQKSSISFFCMWVTEDNQMEEEDGKTASSLHTHFKIAQSLAISHLVFRKQLYLPWEWLRS